MNHATSLILGYLSSSKNRVNDLQVTDYYDKIPYTSMALYYSGLKVEIQVFTDTYIKVISNSNTSICNNVQKVYDYLYNLESLYYRV